MPEGQLRQLYMATSLEALNQKVNIKLDESPKLLINSAHKVLQKAELSDKSRDEELAYLYFMRYFSIIKVIQQHTEYKNNKKYYDSQLNPKNTKKIIQRAEELSKSLARRYYLLVSIDAEEKKEKEREKEFRDVEENKEKVKKQPTLNSVKAKVPVDGFIACDKLYSLSKEKVSSYLIVDIRSREEFKSSSMKFSTVINLPEELLKPGLTANKAGREMEEHNRLLWDRRHLFDHIIICDWATDSLPFPSSITVLLDAMDKWDPGKTYRAKPLVLNGGYEMFSLMYPMLVSNPKLNSTPRKLLELSFNQSSKVERNTLLNFEFPDLDTGFLSTPSPDRNISYPHLKETLISPPETRGTSVILPPSVNRDLKPKIPVAPATLTSDVPPHPPTATSSAADSDSRSSSFHYPSSSQTWDLPTSIDEGDKPQFSSIRREDVLPIPERSVKPQELLDNLRAGKAVLDEEQSVLEQSFKAEREALDKLEEVEETHQSQHTTQDEKTMLELKVKQEKLREELEEKKEYVQQMERKYKFLNQQNEEMSKMLSRLFSGQLKIDPSGSPVAMSQSQKEEKDALERSEQKRRTLLMEVEELRKKRKEKEKVMKEEEERRKAMKEEEDRRKAMKEEEDRRKAMKEEEERRKAMKEEEERRKAVEEKKQIEEEKEHQKWATERNSRNRGGFPNDRPPSTKRGGETYTAKLRTSPRSSPVRGGSNIKRSHSALNLSQLKDDSGFSSPVVPNFDRNLKPLDSPIRRNVNAARQRNFEPKYGSVGPTKTGLKNLGNTCYMNSIIQCLSNTFPFAKYFFEGHYSDDLNARSKQRGEVAEEVGAVVRALWCGQYRSIAMWDLKSVVGRFHKAFQGYDQHDSHEFLIKLMDWLHDDLNLICMKMPKMEEQNFPENIRDEVAAESVMEALRERDESIIRNLFHGLHRSVVVCHTCNHRSLTFEPFSVLTVSFPVSGRCTLKDMLYEFYRETRLEYKCAKCRRMRECTRKFDIWKLPPVLIIHLNRFEHDVLMKKKQNFVDFPLENLNLLDFTAAPSRYHSYDLYGVSNHYGTIDGGHYTSFCKSPNKTWYKFDDHEVYDLPRESVRTSAAYILFYEASNLKALL